MRGFAILSLVLAGAASMTAASVPIGQLQITNSGGYQLLTFYNLTGQGNGGCDGAVYRVCNGITIRSWTLTLTYANPGNSNPGNAPPASSVTFTSGPSDAIGPYLGSGSGYTGSRSATWELPLTGVGGTEPACPPCDYQLTNIDFSGTIDSSGLPLSIGSPGSVSQFGAKQAFQAEWVAQSADPSQPGYLDYGNPQFFGGTYDVVVTDEASGPAAAALAVSLTHSGSFVQGQSGGAYSIMVRNGAAGGPTSGAVTVTHIAPFGMTVTSVSGLGWTCAALPVCTRTDVLPPAAAYPPIAVLMNVAADANSPLLSQVSVIGGGSAGALATDSTVVLPRPANLTVTKSHAGSFAQGQTGATYAITVGNAPGAGATSGTVTVTETLPPGLALVSMNGGPAWTCSAATGACTRGDVLAAGASYDPITVTVDVSSIATSPQVNQVSVTGGGSPAVGASDPTVIAVSQTIAFGPLSDVTYGAAPFGVTATASSGLAVSFGSATGSVCTVSGATVTVVGAGRCTVTASQGGNGSWGASAPVSQTFTVAQASQTIAFGALSEVAYGAAAFGIGATASSGLAVSFTAGPAGVCGILGSTVTVAGVGTCTVTASQAGNGNYQAAAEVKQGFAVTAGAQTIAFGPLSDVAYGAAPFGVTATASSGLAVSFGSATGSVCTVSGATVTVVGAGRCTVTASQGGNGSWGASAPVSQTFTVAQASQTIAFGALSEVAYGAAAFGISATASSGLAVTFTAGLASVCGILGSTVTVAGVGTCTVTASQAGNGNYQAAAEVKQGFAVTAGAQTIAFGPLSDVTYGAAPFGVTATASSGLAVSFGSATGSVCTVSGATVTVVGAGRCTVTASQGGNGSWGAAAPVSQTFTVAQASQTIAFGVLSEVAYGAAAFGIGATASSGLAVTFTAGPAGVCGILGSTVTVAGVGTCTVTASQAGNGNYQAAAEVKQGFAVTAGAQTIAFGPLSDVTYGAAPFGVRATASSGLAVSFGSATTAVCTVSGNVVTILALGTCSITANQGGSADYVAAPTVTRSFAVNPETVLSISGLSGGLGLAAGGVVGIQFTLPREYNNVTIIAPMLGAAVGSVADFYLTTRAGPGATSVYEIARNTRVNIPSSNSYGMTTLFAGLDLKPGTYSLIFAGASGRPTVGYADPGATSVKRAAGVSYGCLWSEAGASYGPASLFSSDGRGFNVQVTGTTVAAGPAMATTEVLVGSSAGASSVILRSSGSWSAALNAPFLHIAAGSVAGAGDAVVSFTYDAFTGAGTRTGTLTIGGLTLTVTQAGADYMIPGGAIPLIASGLNSPVGVAVDSSGSVYIGDAGNNAVKQWNPVTQEVSALVSSGLDDPTGVAADAYGNVYFADSKHNAIKRWSAATQQVTTLASAGLLVPAGVAVDAVGNVYISGADNTLQKWNAATQELLELASGLNAPSELALDAAGNLYVADQNSNTIQQWSAGTGQPTTLASTAPYRPRGVAVDPSGNAYVTDSSGSVKQWSAASRQWSALLSSGLLAPQHIAVDAAGNLYIADTGNNAIKEVPWAFVGPASLSEGSAAGSDALLPVLPSTAPLTGVFAPVSDQNWLTVGSIVNGVVNFSFSANAAGVSRVAHIAILGREITVAQSGLPSQTIAFGALPDQVFGASSFTVSATATSGLAVAFTSLTSSVCTVSSATVALVGVGTCSIAANQAGDAHYAPAPQVTQSFRVSGIASLTIGKKHAGEFTRGQSGAAYTITVSNTGTSATAGTVTVEESAPAGADAGVDVGRRLDLLEPACMHAR